MQRAQTILATLLDGNMNKNIQQRKMSRGEILSVMAPVYAYVSVLYDSYIASVAQDSVHLRELSAIRDKFRAFPSMLMRA